MKKEIKVYNMIFPIWGMILFPPLWIICAPFNFIIDSIVLLLGIKALKLSGRKIYSKTILKVFFFGYLSDIIIGAILFVIGTSFDFSEDLDYLQYEPASSLLSFSIMAVAIFLAGLLIYIFNKKISFRKADLSEGEKKKLALIMAIFTAPYFYMVSLDFINSIFHFYY